MPEANGHDVEQEIKELAAQIGSEKSTAVVERVPDAGLPFEQKTHSLMIESVDKIAQQWIAELSNVRDNTLTLEKMVISQAARMKDEITRFHLLGAQTMKEVQRANEVAQHLADELDAMIASGAP